MRLILLFSVDPSKWTAAALMDWDHPASREALALMDLFDLQHVGLTHRRQEPHGGRPKTSRERRRAAGQHGDAAGRSPAEVLALLRPKPPV